jgi:curved DNA-binding protein CbpA/type II secretory pathway pseudopilin PulG
MNYYEILGVNANATEQQIKEGYRREAMKWHPDRHEGAAAKGEADRRFKDLAQAYRTLSKPAARAEYDRQLEQNLRHEYEARQQEQARQQRAQSEQAKREQAQQEQARQAPPRPEFADTGPQFEEETVSGDDANQMFFEQMLDLAFELAGRGFPEDNISKALIALGCPESMAKAVATVAANQAQAAESATARPQKNQPERSQRASNTATSKETYYRAAIGPKNQEYYLKVFQKFDSEGKPSMTWPSLATFFISFPWLCYRKMWVTALLYYLILPFIVAFSIAFLLSFHSAFFNTGNQIPDNTIQKLTQLILIPIYWIYIPVKANSIYYKYITKKISKVKLKTSDINAQLDLLTKDGGVSKLLGGGPFAALIAISIIGILAAVALPAYQDYTRRAMFSEALAVGLDAASSIEKYYYTNKRVPNDLVSTGYSDKKSNSVSSVDFKPDGGIVYVRFSESAFPGKSLLLVPKLSPENKLVWLCTDDGIEVKYISQSCKNQKGEANSLLAQHDEEVKNRRPKINTESLTIENYISELRKLEWRDRIVILRNDIGIRYPLQTGVLSQRFQTLTPNFGDYAKEVEKNQIWWFDREKTPNNGFIVLRNVAPGLINGVIFEVATGHCNNKGNVYYTTLNFSKPINSMELSAVNFAFPEDFTYGGRCIDIVDLIP